MIKPGLKTLCLLVILVSSFGFPGCGRAADKPDHEHIDLVMLPFDNGVFKLQVPAGWQVFVGGQCSMLAFVVRDPAHPMRQVFFFGQVGPFYLDAAQKRIDRRYMDMGGYPVPYIDAPVVRPLNPASFLQSFPELALMQAARQFMPQRPILTGLTVVSSEELPAAINSAGARTALLRAVFREKNSGGQGLFQVTTAPLSGPTGGPGGNTGMALLFSGITAPLAEFTTLERSLAGILSSFDLNPEYTAACRQSQQDQWAAITRAGRVLSETSDLIMESWHRRNRSDDIIAAKRSDAILGRERLYNPRSGLVLEFENGFYERYRLDPGRYLDPDLLPLPGDDHRLWTAPSKDGNRYLQLNQH